MNPMIETGCQLATVRCIRTWSSVEARLLSLIINAPMVRGTSPSARGFEILKLRLFKIALCLRRDLCKHEGGSCNDETH